MRPDEVERMNLALAGMAVVANDRHDKGLIAWARENGLAVRIDRKTRFGNPFLMKSEDERDAVCKAYRGHLEAKPDLVADAGELAGKVLICWCHPLRCHGDQLAELANGGDAC